MPQNYIVGYGSLISSESRARTGISGEAFPVIINGIEISWSLAAPNYYMTAVGVAINPNSYEGVKSTRCSRKRLRKNSAGEDKK